MKRKTFCLIGAAVLALTSAPLTAFAADESVRLQGQTPDGSYHYEVYNELGKGEVSFQGAEENNGAFSCSWDSIRYCYFNMGRRLAQKENECYRDLQKIECEYALNFSASKAAQFGICGKIAGFPVDGEAEREVVFYIIDGFSEWKPSGQVLGTVMDNGCTYEIICQCQTQGDLMPAATERYEYFSVITDEDNAISESGIASYSHRINIMKHMKAWEDAGLPMNGRIENIDFTIEAYEGSGEAAVTRNEIRIGTEAQSSGTCTGKTPDGSYDYEYCKNGDQGEAFFDGAEIDGGAFSCKWDNVCDCTFSKGHVIGAVGKSYRDLGNISCDYTIEYAPRGISQFGVHGYVESREKNSAEAAEFVIVDGFSQWRPIETGTSGAELLGQYTVNDCTYDIYRVAHFSTSMLVSSSFYQYISVITSEDNPGETDASVTVSHCVDIDRHFREWENVGIDLSGALQEVSFWVVGADSAGSSGEAKVTKNEITFGTETEPDYLRRGTTPDGSLCYEIWNSGNTGEVSFTGEKINSGAFSCKWNGIDNCSFSKGYDFQSGGQSYKALGEISCKYAMEFTADGVSCYGISGTVESSELEGFSYANFMIVDGYTGFRPPGNAAPLKTVIIDGYTYDLYRCNSGISIDGTRYPLQYLSVIAEKNNWAKSGETCFVSDYIDIYKHFEAWEKAGMQVDGKILTLNFNITGSEGSGEANVIMNKIVTGANNPRITSLKGDVNGNGAFGIADAVLLHKWLLAEPGTELNNWEAADFNRDGRLDARDLTLLIRTLMQKTQTPVYITITEAGGYDGFALQWTLQEKDGSYLLSRIDLNGRYEQHYHLESAYISKEISKKDYEAIMSTDFDKIIASYDAQQHLPIMDGVDYATFLVYADGTSYSTGADMGKVAGKLKDLLEQ